MTIRKVVTVGDLAPSIEPEQKGGRLLVLSGKVTNPGRPAGVRRRCVTRAFGVTGGGVVTPEGGPPRRSWSRSRTARSISTINPGLTYDVAIVFEQSRAGPSSRSPSTSTGYEYQEEDPLTLDPQSWLDTDEVAARGRFDVDVRP